MQLPDHQFELSLLPPRTRYLLGIDEVGRGPLAGPLTIGAFLLDLSIFSPDEFLKIKVRDSKKLSAVQRESIKKYFLQNNYSFQTFSCSSQEIDEQGISPCLSNLVIQALHHYSGLFDFCLIDGNPMPHFLDRSNDFFEAFNVHRTLTSEKKSLPGKVKFVVKGDSKCFSIAAASIVAKVDRDAQMDSFDRQYPQYGFVSHKGYGTKVHLDALKTHGPCPIHRFSYQPIKNLQTP